jgi:uncharacterized protein YciI
MVCLGFASVKRRRESGIGFDIFRSKDAGTARPPQTRSLADTKIKFMPSSKPRIQNLPRNLKPYVLALFRPGERWNQTEGAEELPVQQLAFLRTQFEAGVYRAAGPITAGDGISAMAIIEAESLEAARGAAEQDPAVVAKRLVVEVHPALLPSLDAVRAEY